MQQPQCSAKYKRGDGTCTDNGRSRGTDRGGAQFEHSSLPATIKSLFNLSGFLTERDSWAGDMVELLTEPEPRTDTPLHFPAAHPFTGPWIPAGGMPPPPPGCKNFTPGDSCQPAAHDVTIGRSLTAGECTTACVPAAAAVPQPRHPYSSRGLHSVHPHLTHACLVCSNAGAHATPAKVRAAAGTGRLIARASGMRTARRLHRAGRHTALPRLAAGRLPRVGGYWILT